MSYKYNNISYRKDCKLWTYRKEYNGKKIRISSKNKIYILCIKFCGILLYKKYIQNEKERKEKNKLRMRELRSNPITRCKTLKIDTISMWKCKRNLRGNLEEVYNICLNTKNCYNCNRELIHNTTGKNKVCMDHNHTTGYFRHVLCNKCNFERGVIDKQYRNVINELKFYFKPLPNVFNIFIK